MVAIQIHSIRVKEFVKKQTNPKVRVMFKEEEKKEKTHNLCQLNIKL